MLRGALTILDRKLYCRVPASLTPPIISRYAEAEWEIGGEKDKPGKRHSKGGIRI